MDFDVVVVGAGPTGLALACELQLAGVHTLVVEQLPKPVACSKAMGVHGRTVEMLELRGLVDRFLDGAVTIEDGHFGSLGVPLDFTALDTRHPYLLLVPQVRTEQLLTERALELGVLIRRGHEVVDFQHDADTVTVGTTGPDGRYQVGARYLVGCDGGGSRVRKLAGINFTGQDPSMFVLIADVRFTERLPQGEGPGSLLRFGRIRPDLRAWFAAFPLGGSVYRVTVTRFDRPFPDRKAPVTENEMRTAITEITGTDFGMHDVLWLSRLTDVSRQAGKYRQGRIFLAGDAAHVHLPAGGQGLNLGIQDAMNLGWKLAAAVHGWAPQTLLDSYQAERYPVAESVLRNAKTQSILMDPDPRYDALRETMRELLRIKEVNRHLAGMLSALDVRYDIPGEHPLIGRRMSDLTLVTSTGQCQLSSLFHTGRGVLLVPEPVAGMDGWRDRVDVVIAKVSDQTGAFLIRPDGHVCWAGDSNNAGSALLAWFGRPLP